MSQAYNYPYDPTGKKIENLVKDYPITLDRTGARAFALTGPFYGNSLKVRNKNNQTVELKENEHYRLLYIHEELFDIVDYPVFSIVYFYNVDIVGEYLADYQLLGGNRQGNASVIQQMISNIANDSSDITLESIIDFPSVLPPEGHLHHISNTYGYENAIDIFRQMLDFLRSADKDLGLNITNQINGINDKYNVLLELISDLENGSGESTLEILNRIDELNDNITDLTDRVIVLENSMSTLVESVQNDINKLNSEVQTNRDNHNAFVEDIESRMSSAEDAINRNVLELESLNSNLLNLTTTINQIQQTLLNHKDLIDALTLRAEALEAKDIELQNNINSLKNKGEYTARLLTASTTITNAQNKHVVQHNGPFTLPLLDSVPQGHVLTFFIQSGFAPEFRVGKSSTERLHWEGSYDTSLKVEDKYCITLVKTALQTWGIYI